MALFSKSELPPKKQVVYCPVCNSLLGTRDVGEWFIAKCTDCQAQYSWQPFAIKPKATLLQILDAKVCGCGRCGR